MSITNQGSTEPQAPELRTERKRRQFFKLYSNNLFNVLKHPGISIDYDYEDGFICPICYGFFDRKSLSFEYDDRLTLEDIPPKSLGGQPLTLTCKICNNLAGSELESHLSKRLHFDEFMQGVKDSSIDARFRPHPTVDLGSTVINRGENRIYIEYDPHRSDPSQIERFNELVSSGGIAEFDLNFSGKYKNNRAEIALLRIAYLLAFSTFGYGFLFSKNLESVQQQLRNPQETIMSAWGILRAVFQDKMLGINIITDPIELRSLLVVFDLKTELRTMRYGVLLPGPTSPGPEVYNWLASVPSPENPIRIKSFKIPEDNYLKNPDLAFASNEYWNRMCQME